MPSTSHIDQIAERVERLLVRHEEVQRTNALLAEQVEVLTHERDSLKSRLAAARSRVDALLERLPDRSHSRTEACNPPDEAARSPDHGPELPARLPRRRRAARCCEAVEKVDTAMCKIRDAGKVKARDRIAVLAALNLAFDVSDRRRCRDRRLRGTPRCERQRGGRPAPGRASSPGWTRRWATTAACCSPPHSSVDFARCQVEIFLHAASEGISPRDVPRGAMRGLQWTRLQCVPGFIFP